MPVQVTHVPDTSMNMQTPEDVAVDTLSSMDQLRERDSTSVEDVDHLPDPGSCEPCHTSSICSEGSLSEDTPQDQGLDILHAPESVKRTVEAKANTVDSANCCGGCEDRFDHACKDDGVQCQVVSGEHDSAFECEPEIENEVAQTGCLQSVSLCEMPECVPSLMGEVRSDGAELLGELKDSDEGPEKCRKVDRSFDPGLDAQAAEIEDGSSVIQHPDGHQESGDCSGSPEKLSPFADDEEDAACEAAPSSKIPPAVSAKRAEQELQQIYSEGQRMVREAPLSLPYHNPPRLSLKEFLAMRRSKPEPSLSPSHSSNGSAPEKDATQEQSIAVQENRPVQLKERLVTSEALISTPRLSDGPLVVCASQGIQDLMQRFTKHATSCGRTKKDRRDDESPSGKSVPSTPVQKRQSLKEQLLQQMMEKREKVLEERLRQHKVYEEEVEEEDALSDSGSEDSAVEDDCKSVGGGADAQQDSATEGDDEEEEIVSFRRRPKKSNPFIEDEAEEYETTEEVEDEENAEEDEAKGESRSVVHEGEESAKEDNDEEENFLGDVEPEGEKRGMWDSTFDDLNVFSPISGLTNVRYQDQNKDSASSTSSPARPVVPQMSPLHHSRFSLDKGAATLEGRLGKALWTSSQQASSQQDMDELVGLCSGSFAARTSADPDAPKLEMEADCDEEHEGDSESGDMTGDEEGVAQGASVVRDAPKNGFHAQDFFEEEAELSGSDVGSDDEEEDDDEEQLLADLLANDTQPLDEEGIREEVGRLHFKHLLDQDKRELKIYQEMLLEDGDLHSEGGGRQRKFRWKHADSDFVGDPRESDSEQEEVETEEDVAWRLQRFEREQWIRDQATKEHNISPKKALTNKLRIVTSVRRQEIKSRSGKVVCGSFLKMGSDALNRIAERLKANKQVDNTGALTTKNFVFRSVDEVKQKKRPSSMPPIGPSCKKVKASPIQGTSVFDHL